MTDSPSRLKCKPSAQPHFQAKVVALHELQHQAQEETLWLLRQVPLSALAVQIMVPTRLQRGHPSGFGQRIRLVQIGETRVLNAVCRPEFHRRARHHKAQ